MNKILAFSFVFIFAVTCSGQTNAPWAEPKPQDYPKLKKLGERVSNFLPNGFEIVKSVSGDLNGDRIPDIAVHIIGTSKKFLYKNDGLGSDIHDTNPRMLLILFKKKSGGYTLAEQNNNFVIAPMSPVSTEPFQTMSIKNGVLRVEFELWQSAGSWGATNATYKFKFINSKFILIGVDRQDYMRNDSTYETHSFNFLTKKLKITTGVRSELDEEDPARRTKPMIVWKSFKAKRRSLASHGPAFGWEIEPDISI